MTLSNDVEARIAAMRANYDKLNAWWSAKPIKVFAHQAERIDGQTARTVARHHVDRRYAYYLHDGVVMVRAGYLPIEETRGLPLLTLYEQHHWPDLADAELSP